jgi:hypothetical protein
VKLKILASILFVGIPILANTQENHFIGGALLNINGISFAGKTNQYWNSSSGRILGTLRPSLGIFVKRGFLKRSSFTLELRYTRKGSIYIYTNQYGTESYEEILLDYIEIPILFGYMYKPNKRAYLFETGIAYSKLISSKFNADDLIRYTGTPNADNFRNFDISWNSSIKFVLNNKRKENILLGLRVSRSIIPIHNNYKIYHFDYGVELDYLFN